METLTQVYYKRLSFYAEVGFLIIAAYNENV
jgi:hypothetical protein